MAEHHVEHEEDTVGKGEHKSQWLPTESYISEKPPTSGSQEQCADVAGGPCPERGQGNRANELDSSNCSYTYT